MSNNISQILENDFDWWSCVKQRVNIRGRHYFQEGEIWWAHIGLNVGVELNGKSTQFLRPILIFKKYNQYGLLSAPLSTSPTVNAYRIPIGLVNGRQATVTLSQLRNLDSRRLTKKITVIDSTLFAQLKKKASEVNFC